MKTIEFVICAGGRKYWYQNGSFHRDDGPALEYIDGPKAWYQNGKYHREDGPAYEHPNVAKRWYLNNKLVTEEEVMKKNENN